MNQSGQGEYSTQCLPRNKVIFILSPSFLRHKQDSPETDAQMTGICFNAGKDRDAKIAKKIHPVSEEEKMSRNRFFYMVIVLAFLVIGALTLRFAIATSAVVSSGQDLSDYALRHPNSVIPSAAPDLSDYALRHPNATIYLEPAPDLSDYALRHRDEISRMVQSDLSDYALRHPGATIRVEPAPDLSDYALRHADEIRKTVQPDLSDYALRHPGIVPPAVASPPPDPAGYFNVVSSAVPDAVQGSVRPPELYDRVQAPGLAGYWNTVSQSRVK
jgi:hypothetical protein